MYLDALFHRARGSGCVPQDALIITHRWHIFWRRWRFRNTGASHHVATVAAVSPASVIGGHSLRILRRHRGGTRGGDHSRACHIRGMIRHAPLHARRRRRLELLQRQLRHLDIGQRPFLDVMLGAVLPDKVTQVLLAFEAAVEIVFTTTPAAAASTTTVVTARPSIEHSFRLVSVPRRRRTTTCF